MPLVRISLLKGKSNDQIRAIADSVHQALTETYQVPVDDRFQLIHQHEPEEFIYDSNYMGIERSKDVVFINILASNWRDTATKKRLYRRLAELLSKRAGLRPQDVQVSLAPNTKEDWSFGNGLASYITDPAESAVTDRETEPQVA